MTSDLLSTIKLADFLRLARERISGGISQKRLSELSGVSPPYVNLLESTDRNARRRPSQQKLAALFIALSLTPKEMTHGYDLAQIPLPESSAFNSNIEQGKNQAFLDQLNPVRGAFVTELWDIFLSNESYRDTFPGLHEIGNILLWFFEDEKSKSVMIEWASEAELTVSWLRSRTALAPNNARLLELFERLSLNPEFKKMYFRANVTSDRSTPLMLVRDSPDRSKILNVRLFPVPGEPNLLLFLAPELK